MAGRNRILIAGSGLLLVIKVGRLAKVASRDASHSLNQIMRAFCRGYERPLAADWMHNRLAVRVERPAIGQPLLRKNAGKLAGSSHSAVPRFPSLSHNSLLTAHTALRDLILGQTFSSCHKSALYRSHAAIMFTVSQQTRNSYRSRTLGPQGRHRKDVSPFPQRLLQEESTSTPYKMRGVEHLQLLGSTTCTKTLIDT